MLLEDSSKQLRQQVLIYPVVDMTKNRTDASLQAYAHGYIIPKWVREKFSSTYIPDSIKESANEWKASPVKYQGDMSKLPPTLVIVARFDPLYVQGLEYAKKLEQNGVQVTVKEYDDVHGFFAFPSNFAKVAKGDVFDYMSQKTK
eukprot:TRINITY_DN15026_c0_g1_i1.p1 TRINITY_DN15026_c0_g1~~TRINITY_DN15026_c0_g1_i1.p1  ORF type:complete len:145 (+),score=31.22 TRINITY_DN15026_c0_g1_i1:237-671(+)